MAAWQKDDEPWVPDDEPSFVPEKRFRTRKRKRVQPTPKKRRGPKPAPTLPISYTSYKYGGQII